uniref:Uncharacterized protein n=1 Tax=Anguilla anguilla TaxID=7936 RepID=A0A0E9PAF6_ANGAN
MAYQAYQSAPHNAPPDQSFLWNIFQRYLDTF